ncbi:MAG: BglG family transcription antiterminator [Clostridia bacterium]|jgi:mannitol operon transcriptional antiterminator|nr:BglG family transcription antiterminator [Clostridia bacterium]HOH88811.1 BglG family transcription antiterminator [Bacillota bacterium]
MDSFTVRQKFILNNLIEKGPLTVKGLSQQIDVSERTILREVSSINVWLKQHRLRISDRGGRLHIIGGQKDINTIRELFDRVPLLWLLTQEQRQVLITAQLLLSHEPIKSAYFSCQFNVVEGTVIFYLDKIESWLRTKNLKLIRRRGYGLEIIGSCWNKRNAFVELLYNYKSISELLAFLYENNNDYSLHAFFSVTFGEELVSNVKTILKTLYSESKMLKNNDVDYFSAFIHMLLAIERTRSGMPIELPGYIVTDILNSNEYSFIKDVERILKENEIKLPDNELAYLAIHLTGNSGIYKDDKVPKELGFDIDDTIREIIYLINKRLNAGIECDSQLMAGLKQHLSPALYRLTMGLEVRNPVINEIKEYYRDLFYAVDYSCRHVFSKYNLIIPDNEIGYVTMHIGAALERQQGIESRLQVLIICPNGISTAKILLGKLKRRFPEIDGIDVCSLREMEGKIHGNYDIILSTVEVSKKSDTDIIVISPFLPNRDIDRIRALIKSKTGENSNLKNNGPGAFKGEIVETEADFSAADNMLKNFKLRNISSDNMEGMIKKIVYELFEFNLITETDKVENQIRMREEKGSVVIPGSHVALIHIRTEEIDMPFVGVFRLENYIGMKSAGFSMENVDTILVMLARKNESDYILELLGKISASLVQEESVINILRFGDIKDIRNKLVEIINREES